MKKYFMFVAVAAAGMLASCSSESLTAGSDPTIEPTQEERVPILLGVSSPSVEVSRGTTRATGTVGGVGTTDPNNVWAGQRIHAFMFVKNSLNLAVENETGPVYFYNGAEMITPGTADNLIPGMGASANTAIGEAMLTDGTIKYYPAYGNFDFFGYHGDNAVASTPTITKTAELWTVPFTITGSQDLMSTKAELTGDQTTALGGSEDYYSAKAARKDVQPVLSFDHLLTRLAFEVKAGNDNAGGWVVTGTYDATTAAAYNANLTGAVAAGDATPADYAEKVGTPAADATLTTAEADAYNATLAGAVSAGDPDPAGSGYQDPTLAVHVESIEVNSKTKGTMAVAWTNEPANKITWDDNGTPDDASDDGVPAWLVLNERPITTYCLSSNPATTITKTAYDALPDGPTDGDANDKTDYYLNNANEDLVALTPTYPVLTKSTKAANPDDPTPIGEALIVAPSTENYQMKVNVSQLVPLNWTGTPAPDVKYQDYDLEIPAPQDGFKANTSYKVVLTVYGFERIKVTTEIIPWTQGSTIPVGQDE